MQRWPARALKPVKAVPVLATDGAAIMADEDQGRPAEAPAGETGAALVPPLDVPAHRPPPPPPGETDKPAPTGSISEGLKEKMSRAMEKAQPAAAMMAAAPEMEKIDEGDMPMCGEFLIKDRKRHLDLKQFQMLWTDLGVLPTLVL